jgi:predicted nucleic acid-binding protein
MNADDDQILAIAITGSADALVTGDADLLALGPHGGVNISSVAGFEVLARG